MIQGLSRQTRHAMRRARRRRDVWMNIVSMIDILTVLVFFLLMNATGVSILGLQLPTASAAPTTPPAHQITIALLSDGLQVADNGATLSRLPRLADGHYDLARLSDLLLALKQKMPTQKGIVLLMQPTTSYDALVAVMDTVKARPAAHGPAMIPLFPDISLGDAPRNAALAPTDAHAAAVSRPLKAHS
ncbi:MAG TPA: biopolymer transporter ExbD [Nevskiaceae bacterium]|nr:biopolymer transporter ExbD [Nevskiaceae bacterium]